tara:strand:- start:106361 stop:106792 length:432 start_codon:yes stop_codon:yes gene_type:complete
MGQETVYFKEKWFYYDNQIISWVQKFMELFLLEFEHPSWFSVLLEELHGDFFIPYRKEFFDQDVIGDDTERAEYCLKMLDLTIEKMESISKRDFFEFIKKDIKNSWCDINGDFYEDEWLNDNENYRKHYVAPLLKLRSLMEDS